MNKTADGKALPVWATFICGGLSAMTADFFTLPIDVTKVRLQLQGERPSLVTGTPQPPKYRGMFHAGFTIAREEGGKALFRGVSPALLRQAVYGTLRVGLYEPVRNFFGVGAAAAAKNGNQPTSLWGKILSGMVTGAIGASVATPTDLIKIRMQADRGEVRRYKGLVHAFASIIKEEGFFGLWKGVVPTTQRAAILNAVELSSYDQVKEWLLHSKIMADGPYAHFVASFVCGFFATVATSPVDVVKTRIMNQNLVSGGPVKYRGSLDCLMKTVQEEGFWALYKGFVPNYTRIGPWCVIMFMTYEQLKLFVGSYT